MIRADIPLTIQLATLGKILAVLAATAALLALIGVVIAQKANVTRKELSWAELEAVAEADMRALPQKVFADEHDTH